MVDYQNKKPILRKMNFQRKFEYQQYKCWNKFIDQKRYEEDSRLNKIKYSVCWDS